MASPATITLTGRYASLLSRLHGRSCAAVWDIDASTFARHLERIARQRFGEGYETDPATGGWLESLHLDDLALVAACLEGRAAAWEHLVEVYRMDLRQAGRAIGGDRGLELADSIFAELYGLDERDGERRSLLRYFHGRSRLSTWLRAVLAQRHVDHLRALRRLEPLDEAALKVPANAGTRAPDPPEPNRGRYVAAFRHALSQAVAQLDATQRQRLSWYYAHQLTLAQIGRLLGEHEATVSRKLERARRDLRTSVERHLRERHCFTDAEVNRSLELGLQPAEADIGRLLAAAGPAPSVAPSRPVAPICASPAPDEPSLSQEDVGPAFKERRGP